jgi:hypothetical protein
MTIIKNNCNNNFSSNNNINNNKDNIFNNNKGKNNKNNNIIRNLYNFHLQKYPDFFLSKKLDNSEVQYQIKYTIQKSINLFIGTIFIYLDYFCKI